MAERRSGFRLGDQLTSLTPLLIMWTVALVALAGVGLQRVTPMEQLFLDPSYLSDQPWYTGVLSDVGILVWAVGSVAALFGGWVASQTGRPSAARFLVVGSLATFVMLVDDLLQVHSDVLPQFGIPKLLAQLLVVTPVGLWLGGFVQEIGRTRWVLLAAGLVGLGASLAVDVLLHARTGVAILAEDGTKLLGGLAWVQYLVLTSVDITRSTITAAMGKALRDPQREPAPPVPAGAGPGPARP